MPNNSLISKITDEAARKVIYHLSLQIEVLTYRLDKMEQQMKPVKTIGFHQNPSTSSVELAFKNTKFIGGD